MPSFIVDWSIELEADTQEEAAETALKIQRDPNSTATVFAVTEVLQDGELNKTNIIDLAPSDIDE
jgi:hypothetical protein